MRYLRLQCKRAGRLLPRALGVTLLLLAGVLGLALLLRSADGDARQRLRLGVVGPAEDRYLRTAVSLLEQMDELRYSLEFETLSETEAAARLRSGELSAYLRIPEGFFEAFYRGELRPMTLVAPERGGLSDALMRELTALLSGVLADTERAVYDVQDYAAAHPGAMDPYAAGDAVTAEFLAVILDRGQLFETQLLGLSDTLSFTGYYLCALTVFFLLLWGIGAAPLCNGRSGELWALLRQRGVGTARQIMGEFVAYLLLLLSGLALAALAAALGVRLGGLEVPELSRLGLGGVLAGLLPAALLIGGVQFFLYELTAGPVESVLLHFLCALAQGYVCGCFYPASFFPAGLRALGDWLPAGVARRWLAGTLTGRVDAGLLAALAVYAGGFLVLAGLLRRRKLQNGTT